MPRGATAQTRNEALESSFAERYEAFERALAIALYIRCVEYEGELQTPRTSTMSTLPSYDIFFTGPSEDPRHNCVMIGFLDDTNGRPFYLAFETPDIPTSETVTTVRHVSHILL